MSLTKFRIISTGRNCEKWLEKSLSSVEEQNYPKELVKVCITDDASTDSSASIIEKFSLKNNWNFIINNERRYALYNQYRAIHTICSSNEDVIVFVDQDDWLNGPDVLNKLNNVYSDSNVLLTYGTYATNPPGLEKKQPAVREIPADVIKKRSFRSFQEHNGIYWNHLRTFRYGPFKEITEEDLTYPDGRGFFTASPDTALMTPMLELVGDRFRMITDKLLVYNTLQDEPDWRTHLPQIREADALIYSRPVKDLWHE